MSAIDPEILLRLVKGSKLTAGEHDANLTNLKEAIAQLCALIDQLNLGQGDDLSTLEQRVSDNEDAITALLLDIQTLATAIQDNVDAIAQVVIDLDQAELDIQQINVDLNQAESDISGLQNLQVTDRSDIDDLLSDVAQLLSDVGTQAATILTHTSQIAQLQTDQTTNANGIVQNSDDITTNVSAILANGVAIGDNGTAIGVIQGQIVTILASIANIGEMQNITPVLVTQLVGAGGSGPTSFDLNLFSLPTAAAKAVLEVRTELAGLVAADNEGYMLIDDSDKLGHCMVGIGVENVQANDRQFVVDTRVDTLIDVTTFIKTAGTHALLTAGSRTRLFLIGYHV